MLQLKKKMISIWVINRKVIVRLQHRVSLIQRHNNNENWNSQQENLNRGIELGDENSGKRQKKNQFIRQIVFIVQKLINISTFDVWFKCEWNCCWNSANPTISIRFAQLTASKLDEIIS